MPFPRPTLLQTSPRRGCKPPFVRSHLPRGLALFIGGFAVFNVLGNLLVPGFDANLWWIDLRMLSSWLANAVLLGAGASLIAFALVPACGAWRRHLTLSLVTLLASGALMNCVQFYVLLGRTDIRSGVPVPLSLAVFGALFSIAISVRRQAHHTQGVQPLVWAGVVCALCAAAFPLLQMFCFGKTNYARVADIAIVPGARVYADGRPSDALADRVRTACDLYRLGLIRKLLFSGGPGDGEINEPDSMKRMAVRLGVHPADILTDDAGLNTRATVRNSRPVLQQLHASRVLVVSHFYHLPRIKMSFAREGREVYTVPARESYLLRQLPYNMAREVAAFWAYYLGPLTEPRSGATFASIASPLLASTTERNL